VNQVGQEPGRQLPATVAAPLCQACALLGRPPILSDDGYALYNWKRFRPEGPIALANLQTLQGFVHVYDEHWFILVHAEIEALVAEILAAIGALADELPALRPEGANAALVRIQRAVKRQIEALQRLPEKMDPRLYHRTFRPYIRFFEGVVYRGVERAPIQFRGETGAQSSIMPTLVASMKIPHRPSALTDHLADMRRYMPREHRALVEAVEAMPSIREVADPEAYNGALEAMARFWIAGPVTPAGPGARHTCGGYGSSSTRSGHTASPDNPGRRAAAAAGSILVVRQGEGYHNIRRGAGPHGIALGVNLGPR
jgi:indoleamine 2,3-dioxygenase